MSAITKMVVLKNIFHLDHMFKSNHKCTELCKEKDVAKSYLNLY